MDFEFLIFNLLALIIFTSIPPDFRGQAGIHSYEGVWAILLYHAGSVRIDVSHATKKVGSPIIEHPISAHKDNPTFVRDRVKGEIYQKVIPPGMDNKKDYHPAWLDYCDPYHCSDYNILACGLNRKTLTFKWFQSPCHIILNNMCAKPRGTLKYDMVEKNNCYKYVLHLRQGCAQDCTDEELNPICGISSMDNHVVLFKNRCALDAANCRDETMDEYEEANMRICAKYSI